MEDSNLDPNFKWRISAGVVCFTLLLSCLSVAYVVYLSYIAVVIEFPAFMDKGFISVEEFFSGWVPFFYVLFLGFLAGLYFWSAIQLLTATKLGQDTKTAWIKIGGWGHITIGLLLFGTVRNSINIFSEYSGREIIFGILGFIILPWGIYCQLYSVFHFI